MQSRKGRAEIQVLCCFRAEGTLMPRAKSSFSHFFFFFRCFLFLVVFPKEHLASDINGKLVIRGRRKKNVAAGGIVKEMVREQIQ